MITHWRSVRYRGGPLRINGWNLLWARTLVPGASVAISGGFNTMLMLTGVGR